MPKGLTENQEYEFEELINKSTPFQLESMLETIFERQYYVARLSLVSKGKVIKNE